MVLFSATCCLNIGDSKTPCQYVASEAGRHTLPRKDREYACSDDVDISGPSLF